MLALKNELFSDLKNPMEYLHHRNFDDTPFHCEKVKTFKDFAFLKDKNGGDSYCVTMPSKVLSTTIHLHNNIEYNQITVELDSQWIENITPCLKEACKRVFDTSEALVQSKSASFDVFWNTCQMPFQNNTLTIKEAAFTKRGHKKQFINIYNKYGKEEALQIYTGGSVILSLGFYMYENIYEDQVSHGFRPKFVGGIRILNTGGPPPILKSPWSWHDITFPSMSIDMHDFFQVRMPPMYVLSVQGDNIELNLNEKTQFKNALQALYTLAGIPWPNTFYVQKPRLKKIIPGSLVLVVAKPSKNNNQIVWEAQKIHCTKGNLPGVVQAAAGESKKKEKTVEKGQTEDACLVVAAAAPSQKKRPSDTLDSWLGVQTKKQCT